MCVGPKSVDCLGRVMMLVVIVMVLRGSENSELDVEEWGFTSAA